MSALFRATSNFGQRMVALLSILATLSGCAVSEINGNIDALNRSIKGIATDTASAISGVSGQTSSGTSMPSAGSRIVEGSVSFRRRVSGDDDIVRMPVEDGAMQLRIGHDFSPTATVDNAMPYFWSASCDLFYLTSAHLPDWVPPPDRFSKFSFADACALDEGGLAFHHSAYDAPIRKRKPYQLNTAFGVSDAIKDWFPVYQKRRTEIQDFKGDRYFFIGVQGINVEPYDPVKQGFFITVDLRSGYRWNKPIVFVGKQFSGQRLNVNLKTGETLARAIDSARSSNYRLRARQTKVVFKLNGAKEFPDRIELTVTLEKVEVPVYASDGKTSVLINLI